MDVRPALLAALLGFLPALAGATAPVLPEAAPGQVLVRFNDGLPFCAETAFAHRGTVPALEGLFTELQVTGVEAVFRSAEETLQLAAGRSTLGVGALRQAHRRKAAQLLASRPRATGEVPELFHVYRFQLAPGRDAVAAASRLAQDPRVIYAEPNHLYTTDALPDDRFVDRDGDGEWEAGTWGQQYSDLWGHEFLGWSEVWERQSELWTDPARIGGGGVTVAVVDTGVDVDHPDLAANVWRDAQGRPGRDTVDIDLQAYLDQGFGAVAGEDYSDPDFDPQDRIGHGTHVAGTVAAVADNGVGIAGVAWGSRLMAIRAGFALQAGSVRRGILEADDIAAGLLWAADHGADVVNMSFGGSQTNETIGMGVEYLVASGALPVASAGNASSAASVDFPASHKDVVAVGSVDPLGRRSPFSNHGRLTTLVAPGTDVLSLRARETTLTSTGQAVENVYIRSDGTSMAAPHVAATAALALSAHPGASAAELRGRLEGTSRSLDLSTFSGRGGRQLYGYGAPDPLSAVTSPARPSLRLLFAFVGDQPGNGPDSEGNNANGLADVGELIRLSLTLQNVWRPASGAVELRLSSPSPFVRVTRGTFTRNGWQAGLGLVPVFHLRIAPGTPPLQTAPLVLDVQGQGWSQRLTSTLELNPPAPFAISLDVLFPLEDQTANVSPAVLPQPGGETLVIWLRQTFFPSFSEMWGRRLGPRGELLGEEFLLDFGDSVRFTPITFSSRPEGGFAAVWRDSEDPQGPTIKARFYEADGRPASEVIVVETEGPDETYFGPPDAAVTPGGGLAVTWGRLRGSTEADVRLKLLGPDHEPLGDTTTVETSAGGFQSDQRVILTGTDLVVVWRSFPGIQIKARRFGLDGTALGAEFQVNQDPGPFEVHPSVTALPGGGFLATWDNCLPPGGGFTCTLRGRGFDGQDRPLGDEQLLSEQGGLRFLSQEVAAGPGGGAAVTWDACTPGLAGCGVRYRALELSGAPAGEVLEVQHPGGPLLPSLAASAGGFLMAWDEQNGRELGVFGQVVKDPRAVGPCEGSSVTELCLGGGRFRVKVDWKHPNGDSGAGQPLELSDRTGAFWFFRQANTELLVKVLDGRPRNDYWWVFYASLSNVEYTLTVTDTETGAERIYENPPRTLASVGDTLAFPVLPAGAASQASEGGPGLDPAGSPLQRNGSASEGGAGLDPNGSPLRNETAPGVSQACGSAGEQICLQNGRFSLRVHWRDSRGNEGEGFLAGQTHDTGYFSFFNEANIELAVKILDGRSNNGRWWVFYGSLSNVEYTLTVTDLETGAVRTYTNPQGTFASAADTRAF